MKIIKIVIVGLAVIFSTSCKKKNGLESTQSDYLVFGHFYGMCAGEMCVETFKLTDVSLFEDTIDDYSGQNLVFVQLANDKFEEVNDLMDFFPAQLLNETKEVLGCPDCADGGGLYIKHMENGTLKSWRIDQSKDNVPSYLHGFMDQVNERIALINK